MNSNEFDRRCEAIRSSRFKKKIVKRSSTRCECREKPSAPSKNAIWEKLQIQAKFVRDLRGNHTKVAHKDPSNRSLQQISRDLGQNAKNENSLEIHPKMAKKKNARD